MRKFLLTVLSCLAFCFALAQETATIDGIKYSLYNNGEAMIMVQDESLAGDIVIPEKVSYNGTDYTVTSADYGAFSPTSITSIVLPNSITSLGWFCFKNCSSLKSITLPDGITSLSNNCFEGCSGLTFITLPDNITSLGHDCFLGCSSLKSITLHDNITFLGRSCFSGCSSLKSITLPESINSLRRGCFSGCSSLESVILPDGITSLGRSCFSGCSSLTSITLPKGLTSLENSCFRDCSSLEYITLSEGITSLESSCFDGCSSLKSITLPESITSLGESCFDGCSSLESITLPESITSLSNYCFEGCSSLTSITLPNSIIDLGHYCFRYCENLKSVVCKWENLDNVTIRKDIFDGIFSDARLYVPVGTADMYKATKPWSNFKYIGIIDENGEILEEPEKCATPVISYADGKLVFTCETEGAEYYYTITDEDIKKDAHSQDGTVELTAAYNISVYATADGCISSDEAKAVLYFIKAGSGTDVGVSEIFAEERGVVLSTDGQTVTASGLADGEAVSLYTTDGMLLSTAKASADGIATLDAKGERGVLIVKVGNDGLKIAVN